MECSETGSTSLGILNIDLSFLCPQVLAIGQCAEKALGQIFAISEPRSVGSISVGGADGKSLQLSGNYIKDSLDESRLLMGASYMLQTTERSAAMESILEKVDMNATAADVFGYGCSYLIRRNVLSTLGDIYDAVGDLMSSKRVRI